MVINNAFYPEADVERAVQRASRATRSTTPRASSSPRPRAPRGSRPATPTFYHLLVAQAHIPPTEQIEVAGFTGTGGIFDDGLGSPVPPPDPATGSRNEPIRQAVLDRLNATPNYRALFGALYPSVGAGGPITFTMFGQAIAEFEFTLTFADAPIDRFARGDRRAMTAAEARGAAVLRRGRLRPVPRRGGALERDVQRLRDARDRHPAGRPGLRGGDGQLRVRGPGATRTSAWRSSRATRQTATGSAPRRCATSPCSRRSSTTAASQAWRTRSATTTTLPNRLAVTTRCPRGSASGHRANGTNRADDRTPGPAPGADAADGPGVPGSGRLRRRGAPRSAGDSGKSASPRIPRVEPAEPACRGLVFEAASP